MLKCISENGTRNIGELDKLKMLDLASRYRQKSMYAIFNETYPHFEVFYAVIENLYWYFLLCIVYLLRKVDLSD